MPKVVLDQRERYDQSELFAQLSSDSVIVYAGFGNLAAGAARRDKLLGDLALRRVELAFTSVGLNFQLCLNEQLQRPNNMVRLTSEFILDGVCVKFVGELSVLTMEGTGRIEFDQRRAQEENERLLTELQQYRQVLALRQSQPSQSQSTTSTAATSSQGPVASNQLTTTVSQEQNHSVALHSHMLTGGRLHSTAHASCSSSSSSCFCSSYAAANSGSSPAGPTPPSSLPSRSSVSDQLQSHAANGE